MAIRARECVNERGIITAHVLHGKSEEALSLLMGSGLHGKTRTCHHAALKSSAFAADRLDPVPSQLDKHLQSLIFSTLYTSDLCHVKALDWHPGQKLWLHVHAVYAPYIKANTYAVLALPLRRIRKENLIR
ncbi:hypothetical protein PMIN06_004438 [Paraphaeosphaeria minitans]